MIILVGSEKGGTGKTTIAVNLAAMCALAGKETLLVDTDRQESASTWAAARAMTRADAKQPLDITCVAKSGKVGYDLQQLAPKFDVVIVDAGGRDSVELRQALAVCDTLLIPVRPSQFDTWSLDKMATLIKEITEKIEQPIDARVLLNATHTNPSVREADEVRMLLAQDYADSLKVMVSQVGDRISYRRAARDGLGVTELARQNADGAAVEEIQRVYKEIFNEKWTAAAQKPALSAVSARPARKA